MNIKKVLLSVAAILLLIVIIVFMGLYILFEASLPEREGEIQITGINSTSEILFDEKGIPQIWAESEEDAWFAVGWLHASDRLFQMELTRRVATGRLSELFGDLTLSFDRKQRLVGHHVIAEKDITNLQNPTKRLLASYSAGINKWVDQVPALPFEFQLLNTGFEPWSIKDCLSIISFQTWFSDDLQNNDDFFISLEKSAGKKRAEQLISPYPREAPKTVPQSGKKIKDETEIPLKFASILNRDHFVHDYLFAGNKTPFLMTESSNAWAVSGRKSKSGKTLFASDPHLELSRLPQFWYVVGVHTKDGGLGAIGVTTPGIPLFAMGHNGKIAWAFTAAAIDITDEYIERLNPDNPNEYQVGEQFKSFKKRVEYIKVSGWDEVDTLEIRSSRHGPVIQDGDTSGQVITMRWAGFDFSPSEGLAAGFQIVKSTNFTNFRKCVTSFGALDANWIYADHQGNIGYQLGTPVPIREEGSGHTRMIGWDNKSEWSGYYELDKTPHAYNPEKGWLASCNNKPDEANLDYSLFGNFADERIQRITELLSTSNDFSLKEMKQFQTDLKSVGLIQWKEEAVKILNQMDQKEWVRKLDAWHGNADLDSRETALIETWVVLLKTKTFSDEFGDLTSKFLHKILYRDRNFYRIYMGNEGNWFDDKLTNNRVETRNDIAKKAMEEAMVIVGDRTWGDLQTLTMSHPLAAVPILSSFLSLQRGPFPRAGTNGSLNNATSFWDKRDSFVSQGGPSWRFVLDFDNIDLAQMVIPSGQSGNPLSPHFFDFYDLWEGGEYWTVPFTKEKVEERAVSKLKLIPLSD
ncbi:MAG: penicillin acylase family protein [Calditrichia bacterium]|nr:penicillin acylase family protein [Calditrichia bacterium]